MVSDLLELGAWIGSIEAAGFAGAALGGLVGKNAWYDELPKPALFPRQAVFPLAWSLMNYPSLALATRRIWREREKKNVTSAMSVFALVMLVNVEFGFIVNRAKRTDVYVLMDVIGTANALALFSSYFSIDRRAARLTLPYVAWCFYTTAIKVALHRHNAG